MIKANELRIGNIVEKDGIQYVADFITIKMADNYSPIKLTSEILYKCGFEDNNGSFWKIGCNLVFIENEFWYDTKCSKITQIKYVHQMQNLIFALTGHELEINL